MKLYTRLCSNLLFPLHERKKGHDSVTLRRSPEDTQWWSERLRFFLQRIGATVPYYRELFRNENFDPTSVDTIDVLQQQPLLTKSSIRANVETAKAEQHDVLSRYNTGGSSGEPLIFFVDKARKSDDVAAKWRARRWWGVDIGDPELVVWGSPVELGAQDRIRRIRDRAMRSHLLLVFEMSAENIDRFVATIRRILPTMLFGYPSSLSLIAGHARTPGVTINDLGN